MQLAWGLSVWVECVSLLGYSGQNDLLHAQESEVNVCANIALELCSSPKIDISHIDAFIITATFSKRRKIGAI